MSDYISRADAIEHLKNVKVSYPHADISLPIDLAIKAIEIIPSADTVSREEYEETDGVVKIEKQNANEVGEIKHIVIHSPNYTRYFYNESMEIEVPSADAEPKWNCTASFVAEQLDRLRKMTDEEKWEFFKRFFEMKGGDGE